MPIAKEENKMKRLKDFNYYIYFGIHRDSKSGAILAQTIQTHAAIIGDENISEKQLDAIYKFIKKEITFKEVKRHFKSFSIRGEIHNRCQEITIAVS